MNPRLSLAVLAALSLSILAVPADAKARKARAAHGHAVITCDLRGCSDNLALAGKTANAPGRAASRSARSSRTAVGSGRSRKVSLRPPQGESGPGIIRSGKTGATARVDPRHAAKFQAYVDDLEANHGASIRFMGGWRPGSCALDNQHACSQAIDVCQTGWGRVDRRCNLPSRVTLAKLARVHGLFDGAEWCGRRGPDTAHVQVRFSGSCYGNLYAAVSDFKSRAAGTLHAKRKAK